MTLNACRFRIITAALFLFAATLSPNCRANVYATDIQVNGSIYGSTNTSSTAVPISYHLNQAATLGCTVSIWDQTNLVATIAGGTNMGLNTVYWGNTNNSGNPVPAGFYSISITAAAGDLSGGTGQWTQISIDGTNTAALEPQGIDVDKNIDSPYYGRVVVSCANQGTIDGIQQFDGLYKYNADSTPADEGNFGFANYTTNDNGETSVNQMPIGSESEHPNTTPGLVRIGGDDRIYFTDASVNGAVIACDMLATTNQLVICEGPGNSNTGLTPSIAYSNSAHNYSNLPNPYAGYLNSYDGGAWEQFDVAGFDTGHPALYLCDAIDYPSAGVWEYRLVNGASDPNDTVGAQAVATGGAGANLAYMTGSGVSVDDSLDIFVSQNIPPIGNPTAWSFRFNNWNGGVLPPEREGPTNAEVSGAVWQATNGALAGINDTVIDSRSNPTRVAVALYNNYVGNGGVAVLDAVTGNVLETNLDSTPANWYTSVAFDNVGNVYGCTPTANYWRVWSPPGANTNTTYALATIGQTARPIISPVANLVVTPDETAAVQIHAKDANGYQLTYSLGPDSPATATIDTNGDFTWGPTRAFAETTNQVTVIVSNNAVPPQSSEVTFQIVVLDYLQISIGGTNLQALQSASVPIYVSSSSGLTNLVFNVPAPEQLLTNWSLSDAALNLTSATLQNSPSGVQITLQSSTPFSMQTTQMVCQLNFSAASNQPSAFVTLQASSIIDSKPNGASYANTISSPGTVEVVETQPLSVGIISSNGFIVLNLFGVVSNRYELVSATNLINPVWQPVLTYTQTNSIVGISLPATNPMTFYRVLQQ